MRLKILLAGLVLGVGGCASSQDMYLRDGSKGYNIACDGRANSISTCFQKADDLCGVKGYVLLNEEPFVLGTGSASTNASSTQGVYISSVGMYVNRNIFVKCKD